MFWAATVAGYLAIVVSFVLAWFGIWIADNWRNAGAIAFVLGLSIEFFDVFTSTKATQTPRARQWATHTLVVLAMVAWSFGDLVP